MSVLSLRSRLILVILPPLFLVSALLGVWRYSAAQATAWELHDRSLLIAALAISRDVAVSGGDALSHNTNNLIRQATHEDIFYHVVGPDGVFVTGFATPPVPPPGNWTAQGPQYFDAIYRGTPVRAIRLREPVQLETLGGFSIVTVWQTEASRNALTKTLALRSASLMLIILAALAAIVWFGVELGLRPLNNLQAAVSRRSAEDLGPIRRPLPREVQALVATINSLMARLETALKSRDDFISDAAHQLRNPIAAVLGLAEAARSALDRLGQKELGDDLLSASQRASRLTNQLLSFERMRTIDEARPEKLDLADVAKPVAMRFAELALTKGLEVDFLPEPGPHDIYADQLELKEALENLLHNAMVHGGEELSRIAILIRRENGFEELRVTDDGIGLKPQDHEAALERFVQISGTQGSGLGLSIAQKAVERADGSLILKYENPGLTVCLLYPSAK